MWAIPAAIIGILVVLLGALKWDNDQLEKKLRRSQIEASVAADVAKANEEEVRRLLRSQEQALKALKKQKDAAEARRKNAESKLKKTMEAKDAQEPAPAAIAPLLMR